MQLTYEVHKVGETTVSKVATVGDDVVKATVEALEVELVGTKVDYGTIVLRFTNRAEIDEAKTKYVQGQTVIWSI